MWLLTIAFVDVESPFYGTKSIEAMVDDYEDDKNSMISMAENDDLALYDEFYDEMDNRIITNSSMNMIFFGPSSSFLRLDAETILHILSNTKKKMIPITRVLLAWDVITDGKKAAFLQGRELAAFGSLLNVVPEEDLFYTNFGDPSVLRYFSKNKIDLRKRKIGVLVSAYRRYYGYNWYMNSTHVNGLGYLLCGFPPSELKLIPPATFRELNWDVLSRLENCDTNQIQSRSRSNQDETNPETLYDIATHEDAYGSPYKWTSHEVIKLDSLFSFIPPTKISSIQLEAISALSAKVLKSIKQEKLEYFTKQQILRMNDKARRIYLLRVQLRNSLDMSQIAKGCELNICPSFITIMEIVVTIIFYYCAQY